MKLILPILFMGIVSNPASLRTGYSRRQASRPGPRKRPSCPPRSFGTRGDSGFVQIPSLPEITEIDACDCALRRFSLCQTQFGRWLLRLRFEYQKARTRMRVHGPEQVKRGFDIAVSLSLLLLLTPLFALVALLVKLEDGGPIFFSQTRVGRHGRLFKMYKIRSMCLDAEQKLQNLLALNHHRDGVTFKLKDDPRITRVGKYLRKFSIDELPQLFNVLIGNMSLVGPRPPVPREVAMYSLADRRRLSLKPGITCIWQVRGRSQIDFSGQVNLDVDYIENRTFWMDLKLLFLTIPAVVSAKGAC